MFEVSYERGSGGKGTVDLLQKNDDTEVKKHGIVVTVSLTLECSPKAQNG